MHDSTLRSLLLGLLSWLGVAGIGLGPLAGATAARGGDRPNIVVILCDDLGYGDVRAFNPRSRIPTPHIDRLAAEGMRFTDAHSSSAVCSPTRYGLLTGRYNWRSRLQQGVQGGMSPRLIEPGRLTLPGFLRKHGYHTAVVGKWHLGMDWVRHPGTEAFGDGIEKGIEGWKVDFTQPFRQGPISVGFDEFFGIAASLDMVPYCFLKDEHVQALPTVNLSFPMRADRRGGRTRAGPASVGFRAEDVLPELTRQALQVVERQSGPARDGKPFFLYLPLTSPHTPIAPSGAWVGRSGLNAYADFVMETDDAVGQILQTLERLGLTQDTLVIFTSDNGCSPEADFAQLKAAGHDPSAGWRGAKADLFEGGHRVPFIARWPGRIPKGTSYEYPICLNDVMATCAGILGIRLPENAAEDSVDLWRVMQGRMRGPVREAIVHHSIDGSFAVRRGRWKLLLSPSSGGWSAPWPGSPSVGSLPARQLYDLTVDPGEAHNLIAAKPRVASALERLLERYVARGRSTPGAPQSNTVPVLIRKV